MPKNAQYLAARPPDRAAALTVKRCSDADREAWDAFVASQAGGSLYHCFDWSRINRESFGVESHYLMAYQAEQVVGVLPLSLLCSRVFGRILCSMPYVNYGGPCAVSNEVADALVSEATQLATVLKADYLELRCRQPIATASQLQVSLRKLSMTLELDANPDVLWNKFSSKHRNNVRRAEKNQLVVRSGGIELLPDFYSMLELSWGMLGTPLYRRSYFERILSTMPERVSIFVAYQNEAPVGAAFNGYFNGTVEGMWAGGGPRVRELSVNYVLYWEMIRDACQRGYARYHLGRSTSDSGAEEFKKKWNAQAEQLYWYYHRPDGGPMPELNVANPKYQRAIEVWRKLPLWVTRRVGPMLARSIP